MREALIIVPENDNDGNPTEAWKITAEQLADMFGGATIRKALGVWRDPDGDIQIERVAELTVAMDPTEANEKAMRDIALLAGCVGRQKSVYLRQASGEVEFIDIPHTTVVESSEPAPTAEDHESNIAA